MCDGVRVELTKEFHFMISHGQRPLLVCSLGPLQVFLKGFESSFSFHPYICSKIVLEGLDRKIEQFDLIRDLLWLIASWSVVTVPSISTLLVFSLVSVKLWFHFSCAVWRKGRPSVKVPSEIESKESAVVREFKRASSLPPSMYF